MDIQFTFNNTRKEMGLGSFSHITLADARKLATDLSFQVSQDVTFNPIAARRKDKAAKLATLNKTIHTFDEVAAAYIATNKGAWVNKKHANQWTNTLATYAAPVIGGLDVQAIEPHHILKILDPIGQLKQRQLHVMWITLKRVDKIKLCKR
ncbi:MAG: hypothetical protein GQ581_04930 [Methyloprofundus sp.]|nr:hypothetical protein [Methyloprofundus sp.]